MQIANFDFDKATWVVIASLPLSFLLSFFLFATGRTRTVRQIWTNEGSKRVVPCKEMPFGGLNDVLLNLGGKISQN